MSRLEGWSRNLNVGRNKLRRLKGAAHLRVMRTGLRGALQCALHFAKQPMVRDGLRGRPPHHEVIVLEGIFPYPMAAMAWATPQMRLPVMRTKNAVR